MKSPMNRNTRRRAPRGLSLVELLLCASIAAMMLTATGVAFRASVQAYRDNTDRNMLLAHGRVAMRQMISEIRQADAHGPINDANVPNAVTLFAAGQTIENGGIQILKKQPDADDPNIVPGNSGTWVLITWQFDSANKQITRSRSVGGGAMTTDVIAKYVQDLKVRMEPARSPTNVATGNPSFDLLYRAVVTMVLQDVDGTGNRALITGTNFVTERLVDAAVPRKNFSGL